MTRLTMLFIAVALVLPGAAFAMPTNEMSGAQPQAAQDLRRRTGTRAPSPSLDKHGVDQAAANRKASAVGAYYASFGDDAAAAGPRRRSPRRWRPTATACRGRSRSAPASP